MPQHSNRNISINISIYVYVFGLCDPYFIEISSWSSSQIHFHEVFMEEDSSKTYIWYEPKHIKDVRWAVNDNKRIFSMAMEVVSFIK